MFQENEQGVGEKWNSLEHFGTEMGHFWNTFLGISY